MEASTPGALGKYDRELRAGSSANITNHITQLYFNTFTRYIFLCTSTLPQRIVSVYSLHVHLSSKQVSVYMSTFGVYHSSGGLKIRLKLCFVIKTQPHKFN